MDVVIKIEGQEIDLFKDENISLTSAVTSIQEIEKNKGDFSKTFTIPATENNNKIFKNWYRSDIDFNFNASVKLPGTIEIKGKDFKTGFFTLQNAKLKNKKPSSYTINFVGYNLSLTKLLGDDLLVDLDLSEMNHDFDASNVFFWLSNSSDYAYSLITKRRLLFDSTPANINQDNISFDATGAGELLHTELRPSIRVAKILEAIENKYDITFTRDLIGRNEIDNLYFYGWKSADELESEGVFLNFSNVVIQTTFQSLINVSDNIISYTTYDEPTSGVGIKIYLFITTASTEDYEVVFYDNGILFQKFKGNGSANFNITQFTSSTISHNITVQVLCKNVFTFEHSSFYYASFKVKRIIGYVYTPFSLIGGTPSGDETTVNLLGQFDVSRNIINMKTIDFLKGLLKMFKSVIIPNPDGSIYIDDINNYYSKGKLYDITNYIDTDEVNVEPLIPYSQIDFKFAEPKTILNIQYQKNTERYFGDLSFKSELDGDTYNIDLPFENILVENISDQNDNTQTGLVTGTLQNEDGEQTNIESPFLHYLEQTTLTKPFAVLDGTRLSKDVYNRIDYLYNGKSCLFGIEINPYDNVNMESTLYSNFYQDFIEGVFNSKTKFYNFNAYLPRRIFLNLNLNDVLKVNSDYFRIETITTELTSGKSQLKLFPIFDDLINSFIADTTQINALRIGGIYSVNITNLNPYTTDLSVGWITLTSTGNTLYLLFDENTTGIDRTTELTVTNVNTNQEVIISILQYGV